MSCDIGHITHPVAITITSWDRYPPRVIIQTRSFSRSENLERSRLYAEHVPLRYHGPFVCYDRCPNSLQSDSPLHRRHHITALQTVPMTQPASATRADDVNFVTRDQCFRPVPGLFHGLEASCWLRCAFIEDTHIHPSPFVFLLMVSFRDWTHHRPSLFSSFLQI